MAVEETALYYYNGACYEMQLEHLDVAKKLLNQCFTEDLKYHIGPWGDPDLPPLRSARRQIA